MVCGGLQLEKGYARAPVRFSRRFVPVVLHAAFLTAGQPALVLQDVPGPPSAHLPPPLALPACKVRSLSMDHWVAFDCLASNKAVRNFRL